jgi:hypothetical protein
MFGFRGYNCKIILVIKHATRGKATIIKEYSIQSKYLTLGDLLENMVNRTNK